MRWELSTSPHGQLCVSKEMSREEVSFWLLALRANSMDDLAEFFEFKLKVPKESPDEVHVLTDLLAKEWQSVMPDHVRGEIVERVNFFGFQVCRIQWVWKGAQKVPRLIPYTHSSLSWRQDQGMSERGLESAET